MRDIARHAGVSPMTVSRALREPRLVSEEIRRKVDAAVREFGYLPNRIAGSLSSSRSNVVGLVVPSIRNSLYAGMIQAASDVLRANGLHLMIANSGHRLEDEEAMVSASWRSASAASSCTTRPTASGCASSSGRAAYR